MTLKNYIIVTPCKNEEDNLLDLAESIINQTLKPKLWFIFDDGSSDKTPAILSDLKHSHKWIYVLRGLNFKRDLSFHYAEIVDVAIKKALDICKNNNVQTNCIGLIDADMILDRDFFEKLLKQFDSNPLLGIASGSIGYRVDDKIVLEKGRDNLPVGGLRVWRRTCFEDTGGFPISYSADAVSNVLANLQGWDTKKYSDIVGIQTRQTSSAQGLWNGYVTRGKSDYYRDYHPIYVMFKFAKYLLTYPFYIGIAYLFGYIYGIITIKEKIDIPKARKYYRNKHLEVIHYYMGKLKNDS